MYRPSLRQLSFLVAIEERGSFNAAAEECAVTQSTLSAGIKELEDGLQRPLVIRNRKKAALTFQNLSRSRKSLCRQIGS